MSMNLKNRIILISLAVVLAIAAFFYFPFETLFEKNSRTALDSSSIYNSGLKEGTKRSSTSARDSKARFDYSGTYYLKYIKNKGELGFDPDIILCKRILNRIVRDYVEKVESRKVFQGVKKELKIMLREAGIKEDEADFLPGDEKIFRAAQKTFQDRIDARIINFACIKGMVKGLGDRHSSFLTPEEYKGFINRTRKEKYGGIGVRISKKDKDSPLLVVEVFKSGPAEAAGVKRGDHIIKVNDEIVEGENLKKAASKITGKINTKVKITVRRGIKEMDFELIRKRIVVRAVHYRMLKDDIGYIKIDSFKEELDREFRQAYKKLENKGMKALVVDMRNNPGGLVYAARKLSGCFLPRKSLISVFMHRGSENRKIYAEGRRIVFVPIALLVNKYSASSAEIVAAAFKDHKIATIIGEKTTGKGSVQRTTRLKGGCALKLTIERIYSPNGFSINKRGVKPDIEAPMNLNKLGTGEDIQLKIARELLVKKTNNKEDEEVIDIGK